MVVGLVPRGLLRVMLVGYGKIAEDASHLFVPFITHDTGRKAR